MINKTTGYMAAVVKVGGKNRYYVHRILMPDGSEFMFKEKTEPIGAGVPAQKSSKGSAISPAYNDNIADNSKKTRNNFPSRIPILRAITSRMRRGNTSRTVKLLMAKANLCLCITEPQMISLSLTLS